MTYDLVIVSRSIGQKLIQMTQNCIDSAGADNVILVETGELTDYNGVHTLVEYSGPFSYNRALNMGLQYAKGDVHILANNDLIFYEWKTIGEDMIVNGFDSASAWFRGSCFPQGDFIYEGFDIAVHLTGWCIFITNRAYNIIGKLNEDMEFWYSDNVYAEQLRAKGLRHGLFCNSRVDHLGNQTINTMPMKIKRQYSVGQLPKYNMICGRRK